MNQIKYKAWDKKGLMFFDVGRIDFVLNEVVLIGTDDFNFRSSIEDVVLLQFTGLRDKDGVEIYDGDILKIGNKKSSDTTDIAEVKFYRGGFMLFLKGYFGSRCIEYYDGDCEKHEVIGSVYKNPELLKH